MPEGDGAELTMFGTSGFAVVDDRRNATGLGQTVFKLLNLHNRYKVIVFSCEDKHIPLYALRHVLERVCAQGLRFRANRAFPSPTCYFGGPILGSAKT